MKKTKKIDKKVLMFYIFTLGLGCLYAKYRARKLATTDNLEIKTSEKIDFNINDLVTALGGSSNIQNVDSTISNLKVKLADMTKVDMNAIKQLGPKGMLKNIDQLTILFGDNSPAIAKALKTVINK